MFSMELLLALGVLSLINSTPILENTAGQDDVIWVVEIANSTDPVSWRESAILVSPTAEDSNHFSCEGKHDGIYSEQQSCRLYYRCHQRHREVYKCIDGYSFSRDTNRCEVASNASCRPGTSGSSAPCHDLPDGMYANRSASCQRYYRCQGHILLGAHSCDEGLTFSMADQACLPSSDVICVEAECAGEGLFIMPGTRCRAYYKCQHRVRADYLCPGGGTFDILKQECTTSDSLCYEPLCTGRVNGQYPDTSHACRRSFQCLGGTLTSVSGCPAGELFDGVRCQSADSVACQMAESTAVVISVSDDCASLPDGPQHARNADCRSYVVCEDGKTVATLHCSVGMHFDGRACSPADSSSCAFDCSRRHDGYHTDPSSDCRRYAYCIDGRRVMLRSCPDGTLYNGFMCVPSQLYKCPFVTQVDSKCSSLDDGFQTDYASGCSSYLYCSKGSVVYRSSCGDGHVWNGESCVSRTEFLCAGPEPWLGCLALESGLYQDRTNDSQCRNYYHCANGNRTRLTCSDTKVFDGHKCVNSNSYKCPRQDPDSCENRSDGYYTDTGSGCRSYFYCSSNHKITYVCAGSYVFNGKECVDKTMYKCPYMSQECSGLPNGYHHDKASGCRKYFYCLGGDKVITLTCAGNKVFDNQRCVLQSTFHCPVEIDKCTMKPDGFYADTDSGCRRYFQCAKQKQVSDSFCLDGKVFNGTSCVLYKDMSACSSNEVAQNAIPNSSDCGNSLNGFYQDHTSGCRRYFYCIDGKKTILTCPTNQLFNGQLCIDSNSYSCPTISITQCKNDPTACNKTVFESYVAQKLFHRQF